MMSQLTSSTQRFLFFLSAIDHASPYLSLEVVKQSVDNCDMVEAKP